MFKKILVPIHLAYKKNHKKLFKGALNLLDDDGKMSLLYVNTNRNHGSVYPILDDNSEKNYNHDAYEELMKITEEHELPKDKFSINIRNGSVHREILEEAKKMGADAIVMMAVKPGLGNYFISSTAERVIRHAECSVFVVRLTGY